MAASPNLERAYVFGDSFSDNGAGYGVTQMMVAHGIKGAEARPESHYWNRRWSNGPVAVEVLAKSMGLRLVDYAIGGARTGQDNYQAWMNTAEGTGVQAQIQQYLHSRFSQGQADAKGLYVLMAGANDIGNYLFQDHTGSVDELAQQAAGHIESSIEKLAAAGAKNILVVGAPDTADSPALAGDDDKQQQARQFQQRYDKLLQQKTEQLAGQYHFQWSWFDLAGFTKHVRQHASQYGFTHVATACQPMTPRPGKVCDTPDKYFFWDEDHPTRRAHDLIGKAMVKQVQQDLGDAD